MYQKKVEAIYQESRTAGNAYRLEYLNGLEALIAQKQRESVQKRKEFGAKIAADREAYRKQFCEMLGWPLNAEPTPVRSVTETVLMENDAYEVVRVQLEVFEGVQFYGIRMTHKTTEPLPYAIVQHGGLGTPEICSSFFDSSNYNDMTMRVFQRGVHVFAPQLLLWDMPEFGEDPFAAAENTALKPNDACRQRYDKKLRLLGGSITALEIYCISRVLDYLTPRAECNGTFGMTGLSYGGYYTLRTAAVDTRIRAALSCSFFNDRLQLDWPDMVWQNGGNTFCDAEIGALVCPRHLRIEIGDDDNLFTAESGEQEFERLRTYYAEAPQNLHFRVFNGRHEYCPEDDGVEEFVNNLKNL